MNSGVPQPHELLLSDSVAVSRRPLVRPGGKTLRVGLLLLALLSTLLFTSRALAAPASVGLGSAASFSVLGGSTITNTGPTTMFGDLGLSPGSSVTGAPHVLGQTHVDDAVAIGAKNDLTTAYNDAASRPTNGSAGTDLAGQTFSPGVRTASSSLLLSSGSVTLDAQGDPNAVFIFQIGSTLITGSSTAVLLVNGAQACNVFWQVGSSATLGTGTRFVGTIMALATITANTAATIHGRLLAQTGAVNLDTNTITTSNCASSATGSGGGTETATPEEATTLAEATALAKAIGAGEVSGSGPRPPIGSRTTGKHRHSSRHHRRTRRVSKRHVFPRPALPHTRGAFTG
jgi:Ice-binding-like